MVSLNHFSYPRFEMRVEAVAFSDPSSRCVTLEVSNPTLYSSMGLIRGTNRLPGRKGSKEMMMTTETFRKRKWLNALLLFFFFVKDVQGKLWQRCDVEETTCEAQDLSHC